MRIRATITLAAALLLPLTACSSSSDDAGAPASSSPAAEQKPSTTPTPADAAELTAAVQAYTAAYFKGDTDQAYDALSKRCQSKVTPEAYGAVVKKFGDGRAGGRVRRAGARDVQGEGSAEAGPAGAAVGP
jgi:ABC-type Fe3+-hydroxamate transport system substrate-binding protein